MDYDYKFPNIEKLIGKKVIFLLGTDRYIGEGFDNHGSETRVGVAPDQVEIMINWLQYNGVAVDFFFVKGAGVRAGFTDSSYLNIGGQVLFEHQLATMPAPNVVHSLKEPCSYESFIPGPFMRIGALHWGAADEKSGISFLLKKRNFSAIFDGSHIGTNNFNPVRGPMSDYAGKIAAEFTQKHFYANNIENGKVIISGGGIAGNAALNELLVILPGKMKEIILVERDNTKAADLRALYADNNIINIQSGATLTSDLIKDANAVILSAFMPGKPAPDVLDISLLKFISDNSIIVDISIDEKGGIVIPGFNRHDNIELSEVVKMNSTAIEKLQKRITYISDDHLPKLKPKEASIAHGRGILPYIAMMLYCSAKYRGSRQAAKYIYDNDFSDQEDGQARTILQHLNRGLAFYCPATVHYNRNIIGDEKNNIDTLLE